MGREQIPRTWLLLGLCLLAGCVESARSADVPRDLAPGAAPRPGLHVASAPKQIRPDRGAKTAAPLQSSAALNASAASQAQDIPEPAPPSVEVDHFYGVPDAPIREALSKRAIVEVEKGRGGRSLGFKIKLEGGQVGYFKGEQVFSAANWFAEVAAFHLDRMLGLGRVPTVVSRMLPWSELEPAAGKDWRKPEIIVRDGQVKGAFVAWVSGGVRALPQREGWERWMRVKYWPTTAVSPYQRPAVWAQELAQVKRLGVNWRSPQERARMRALSPEPDREDRPAELSDLIVFDYLIRNLDRWGGGNANVLIRGDKGPLIFLDNAAGFAQGDPRPSLLESRLRALQRYRRSTIQAVRSFDRAKFEARLATEPVQPILHRGQLNDLEVRRKALLAWVAEQERIYGEAIWAWE